MKKILVLMLALSLVLCFAACNKTEEESDAPATSTDSTDDQLPGVSDMGGPSDTEDFGDEEYYEEIEISTLEVGDMFLFSEIKDNSWENTFLGLGFTLDDGWKFKTDNELMALNGLNDATTLEEFIDAATQCTKVYDLYAFDAEGLDNVVLYTSKIDAESYDLFSEAKYLQDGITERALENAGYTNIVSEYKLIEIDGRELDALTVSAEFKGNTVYQTFVVFKNDGYIVELGVTSSPENTNEQILDSFYWLKG